MPTLRMRRKHILPQKMPAVTLERPPAVVRVDPEAATAKTSPQRTRASRGNHPEDLRLSGALWVGQKEERQVMRGRDSRWMVPAVKGSVERCAASVPLPLRILAANALHSKLERAQVLQRCAAWVSPSFTRC